MAWLALFLVLAGPFWETKAPADWTDDELRALFVDSPWSHPMTAPGNSAAPVLVYLATAAPMDQAEKERDRRVKRKRPAASEPDAMAEEYRAWIEENRATQIVLAIQVDNQPAFSEEKETRQMQEECVMRIGRRKIKMTGYFPPSDNDPVLRLAFPREIKASDKTVTFELYVPGLSIPFRSVEFTVKDLIVNGRPEI